MPPIRTEINGDHLGHLRDVQGGPKEGYRRVQGTKLRTGCPPRKAQLRNGARLGRHGCPRRVCAKNHSFYCVFCTQINVMRRSFGDICWSLDPSGGNLKVIWAHVEVTSRTFGHIWDSFEPSVRSSGDMWGDLGVQDGPREGHVLNSISFIMLF